MSLVMHGSLSKTVDAVNDALFFSRELHSDDVEEVAEWIVSRHGVRGRYANTFALFPDEAAQGIRLFTGERCVSASSRHIIGEEACRVLRKLDFRSEDARVAVNEATESLHIGPSELPLGDDPRPADGKLHWLWPYRGGTFCCGACSVGMWRHLLAGGFDYKEIRLARGLKCLHDCRRGDGQWRVFPFWYAVLALAEMDMPEATEEIRYAARRLEIAAKRNAVADPVNPWPARRAN